MAIYFDNAATSPLAPEVWDEMQPYFLTHFGNPSSIHSHGRAARSAVEKSRKTVASLLGCSPAEIFFTSGATEADNMALVSAVYSLGVKHIITSAIEHHAVLHTAEFLAKSNGVKLSFVNLSSKGEVDLQHLEELLQASTEQTLVSLMHGNNEIGNLLPLIETGTICRKYNAYFHSDTVQTMGHYPFKLAEMPVDFIVGSAHKFHGPKGIGFIYINPNTRIEPFIHGGSQERNMRAGTENVAGIIGLAKALSLCYQSLDEHQNHILSLKKLFIEQINKHVPKITFNGKSGDVNDSLAHVLSLNIPPSEDNDMLLMNIDIRGLSTSGGSACTSGATETSHVIDVLDNQSVDSGVVRVSFSRYNTEEEVHQAIEILKDLIA